jgi:hypothetical protein
MNLSETITPKSDQLNADDFTAGPQTITISRVSAGSAEQPVDFHWHGGEGRPYKPSKSMRRVIVGLWGSISDTYVGESLTLYCDPKVKFGGQEVGGIKISHATGISQRFTALLTVTRGRREPHIVEPLPLFNEGRNAAVQGVDALKSWYSKLTPADKLTVKPTLDASWKPIAESISKEVEK